MKKRIDTPQNDMAVKLLRTSRAKLGFTQKELAAITGISSQSVADYETFRATVPAGLILQVQKMIARKSPTNRRKNEDRRIPPPTQDELGA